MADTTAIFDENKVNIFERMPVPKAVATLVVPTVLAQFATMIYNLADTFFVGQTGDPLQVAAVSMSFTVYFMISALANLFGIGGGSLISRLLGARQYHDAKKVSSFCLYAAIVTAVFYSIASYIFINPLLVLLGASADIADFCRDYIFWTVTIGGVPTMLGMFLANMIRSEGMAKRASLGIAIGGAFNIILDPIFIFGLGMQVKGAAIATMISNVVSVGFYLFCHFRKKNRSLLSFHPKHISFEKRLIFPIFSVGLPSAFSTALTSLSNIFIFKLMAKYGDTAVAAYGIVRKIDLIPLNIGMGLNYGILPLVAYNYSAKNFDRLRKVNRFSRFLGVSVAIFCVLIFVIFAPFLIELFIRDVPTIQIGTTLLRVASLATPVMIMNFMINVGFQAMGKGLQSLILTSCRQGLLNIPLLFILEALMGMMGIVWTGLISNTLTLAISFFLYSGVLKQLHREEAAMLSSSGPPSAKAGQETEPSRSSSPAEAGEET